MALTLGGNGTIQKDAGQARDVSAMAAAWAQVNGSSTPAALVAGMNISSITDNGAGNYSVNLSAAMPNANFASPCISSATLTTIVNADKTVSKRTINTWSGFSTAVDTAEVNIVFVGEVQ